MSYEEAICDAVLFACRAYQVASAQVFLDPRSAIEDWGVLNAPDGPLALVVVFLGSEEGDDTGGYGTQGARQLRYQIGAQVLVDYRTTIGGDGAIWRTLAQTADGLAAFLRGYERLGATALSNAQAAAANIQRAQVIRTERFEAVDPGGGPPFAIGRQIVLQIDSVLEYTPTEAGYR